MRDRAGLYRQLITGRNFNSIGVSRAGWVKLPNDRRSVLNRVGIADIKKIEREGARKCVVSQDEFIGTWMERSNWSVRSKCVGDMEINIAEYVAKGAEQ